jgi:hypothetical protein
MKSMALDTLAFKQDGVYSWLHTTSILGHMEPVAPSLRPQLILIVS